MRSTRRCVCAYDTDILLDPEALRSAVSLIVSGRWPIIIPFNLVFVEVTGQLRSSLIQTLDISKLSHIVRLADVPRHPEIASRVLSGAIMMCDRDLVVMEGGYNSKMTSYGWEDIEFFKRFEKIGYYSFMLNDYNLIHLDHRRGPDSRVNEMYQVNKREFDKVVAMSARELQPYIESDLHIGPPIDPARRRHLRSRNALRNALLMRRPVHLANKLQTAWRIKGLTGLVRQALHAGQGG
jgi:hypothetical protein